MLGVVEADQSANKYTECAKLESEISYALLLADGVAAAATVGKMSAVVKQTAKREQALNEKMKMDITATVQRSVEASREKQQKEMKAEQKMNCKWRDVMASDRPPLPRFIWIQERTVFLTPNDPELHKRTSTRTFLVGS